MSAPEACLFGAWIEFRTGQSFIALKSIAYTISSPSRPASLFTTLSPPAYSPSAACLWERVATTSIQASVALDRVPCWSHGRLRSRCWPARPLLQPIGRGWTGHGSGRKRRRRMAARQLDYLEDVAAMRRLPQWPDVSAGVATTTHAASPSGRRDLCRAPAEGQPPEPGGGAARERKETGVAAMKHAQNTLSRYRLRFIPSPGCRGDTP